MNLTEYSDADLRKEIERRDNEKKEAEKPIQIIEVDLTKLRKLCSDYIDFVASEDFHDDNDYEYYIYEMAITMFYGKNVWDWINKRIRLE